MPALRLVKVHLTPLPYWDSNDATPADAPAPPSPAMVEYEARRCITCGCRYPSFGFGPPLSHGTTVWACLTNKNEVNRQISATGRFVLEKLAEPAAELSHESTKYKRDVGSPAGDSLTVEDDRQASLF